MTVVEHPQLRLVLAFVQQRAKHREVDRDFAGLGFAEAVRQFDGTDLATVR